MAKEEKKCFIIMPITTPDTYIERYRDGLDHFKHVLLCLFVPAVEADVLIDHLCSLQPCFKIIEDLAVAPCAKAFEVSGLVRIGTVDLYLDRLGVWFGVTVFHGCCS